MLNLDFLPFSDYFERSTVHSSSGLLRDPSNNYLKTQQLANIAHLSLEILETVIAHETLLQDGREQQPKIGYHPQQRTGRAFSASPVRNKETRLTLN